MDDDKNAWRRFQRLKINKKLVSRRARKAETATIRHARKFITHRLDNIQEVRRHVGLWLAGVAVLILSVGLQLVWFQRSYTDVVPSDGETYAEATLGPINTLNPLYAESSAEISASRLIFSSLFTYDTTGRIGGDLVRYMTVSKDGKVYRVVLRPNVKWHDGATLTTKDVAFTVNLIKNPDTRSPLRAQWQDVTVKVLSDTEMQFQLPSIYAAFPHALTFPILPEHTLASVSPSALRENAFSVAPIGSGPFELKLLQSAGSKKIANMTSFDDYFKGKPKLNRFEMHAYRDQDAIVDALKTGQVSGAADLTIAASKIPRYQTSHYTLHGGVYAFINTSRPALSSVKVRKALQLALDVSALRKSLGEGYTPLDLPLIPSQLPGQALPSADVYNPQQASRLLDQAGWKLANGVRVNKKKQPLVINIATTNNPEYERSLDKIKQDWSKLGIKVESTVFDPQNLKQSFTQNILQPRSYDVLIYEISIGADPDVFAFWHSSQVGVTGLNLSMYTSGITDDILTSARATSQQQLRSLKYRDFTKQWLKDVPAIGLYQSRLQYVQLEGTTTLADGQRLVSAYDRYANVPYWTAERASVYKTP